MIQNLPKATYGLETGAIFRRNVGGSMTEIAEVVEVRQDRMGIPHVRFNAHLMRGSYEASGAEQRTLSLESFFARYKERVKPN
jgi:uridylate kinase